jgi:hypothetical protein
MMRVALIAAALGALIPTALAAAQPQAVPRVTVSPESRDVGVVGFGEETAEHL